MTIGQAGIGRRCSSVFVDKYLPRGMAIIYVPFTVAYLLVVSFRRSKTVDYFFALFLCFILHEGIVESLHRSVAINCSRFVVVSCGCFFFLVVLRLSRLSVSHRLLHQRSLLF